MLGISTCWWHNKADRAGRIIDEILQLGLDGVELEYRITHSMYQEMKPRLKTTLPVLSIHNFFPLPEGVDTEAASGDLFLLSSNDPEERSRAIKYAIRTIEHAHDLGATAVVLHLGRVDMPNPFKEFSKFYASGKRRLPGIRQRGRNNLKDLINCNRFYTLWISTTRLSVVIR